jgi:hypothetical protein
MISQVIKFGSGDYKTIEKFVSSLKEDAVRLGFKNYKESCDPVDKKMLSGCSVYYEHGGSNVIVEIRMSPEVKSGNIIVSTSSCIAYDKAIKAIQEATGLEKLLQ